MANWAKLQEDMTGLPVAKRALVDTFPRSLANNRRHGTLINSKHAGKLSLGIISCFKKVSGFPDIGRIKSVLLSCFGDHVGNIVFVSSEKKMLRIHAPSIIAMMADLKSIGDFSIYKRPRIAVSENPFTVDAYSTIASIAKIASPNPATILVRSFVNMIPKSINRVSNYRSPGTRPITITRQAFCCTIPKCLKFFTAILANACNQRSNSFHNFLLNVVLTLSANYSTKRCLWQIG